MAGRRGAAGRRGGPAKQNRAAPSNRATRQSGGAMPSRGAANILPALYGPTSSGKTAMAVKIAHKVERELGRKVVIISADSRQVYRYMDIGTSKTTEDEMRGIPHKMIDVAEPIRKFELEDYARLARKHISDAFAAKEIPFLVGGTGVYFKALLEGWQVDQTAAARASLRRDFPRSMAGDAYAMLRRLSRDTADRVHPNNYEAIINALTSLVTADGSDAQPADSAPATIVFGLDPGARTIDERVALTYDQQVERGLFDEVLSLNARYDLDREARRRERDSPNQVLHTHGYREYFEVALERGKPVAHLDRARARRCARSSR